MSSFFCCSCLAEVQSTSLMIQRGREISGTSMRFLKEQSRPSRNKWQKRGCCTRRYLYLHLCSYVYICISMYVSVSLWQIIRLRVPTTYLYLYVWIWICDCICIFHNSQVLDSLQQHSSDTGLRLIISSLRPFWILATYIKLEKRLQLCMIDAAGITISLLNPALDCPQLSAARRV